MPRKILALTGLFLLASCSGATAIADPVAALAAAAREKRPLIIIFTDREDCHACALLQSEILDTKQWKQFLDDGQYIISMTDLSRKTTAPAARTDLIRNFSITHFPTVILVSTAGIPYALTGYREGGADGWIAHLQALAARQEKVITGLLASPVANAASLLDRLAGWKLTHLHAATLEQLAVAPALALDIRLRAAAWLYRIRQGQGDSARTAAVLANIRRLDPERAAVLEDRAALDAVENTLFPGCRWQEALDALRKLAPRDPQGRARQLDLAGQCLYQLGDYRQAEDHFRRALDLTPGAPQLTQWLASATFQRKKKEANQ